MERCALAAVALAPARIELDRLVGILKRLLKVAERGIGRRAVRVEHVVAGVEGDGLAHAESAASRGWAGYLRVELDGAGKVLCGKGL